MSVSEKNKIFVWVKCGGLCSYKGCTKNLIMSSIEGSESLVGEVAHIVSSKEKGPRGNYDLKAEGIGFDEPENLMLMCSAHHKLIDDNPDDYPVPLLREWKLEHEVKVHESKSLEEKKKDKDKITVGLYVSEFEKLVHLENWLGWGCSLLSAHQPKLDKKVYESLQSVSSWIISRIWPKSPEYKSLQDTLVNFKNVLCDFLITFERQADDIGSSYITKKFYQIPDWNPELYNDLSIQYDYHVWLVEDLFYELTRAINLFCDEVRNCLDSSYRLEEGAVLVQTGFDINFNYYTYRVEYSSGQRYEGLEKFKIERKNRDRYSSVGKDHKDEDFIEMWRKSHS